MLESTLPRQSPQPSSCQIKPTNVTGGATVLYMHSNGEWAQRRGWTCPQRAEEDNRADYLHRATLAPVHKASISVQKKAGFAGTIRWLLRASHPARYIHTERLQRLTATAVPVNPPKVSVTRVRQAQNIRNARKKKRHSVPQCKEERPCLCRRRMQEGKGR